MAYRRVQNPRMVPLAWVRTAVEEQEQLLGRDPWEYGLTPANRKNLETIQRYVHQQGMISKERKLEELFEDTDLGDAVGLEEFLGATMNFADRLAAICARMREEKIDLLIGLHDGVHFIEKPNPVMVLGGFKSLQDPRPGGSR